jgi:SAM-dependent methyltransferase
MLYTYKAEECHLPYMLEQVWEIENEEGEKDFSLYSRLSLKEHQEIEEHVPAAPKVVLDFGCGLGRASIYLNKAYNNPKILFILADREGYTDNSGHFNPEKDEYYNSFNLTRSFCKLNGLENFLLFDTEKDDWDKLPRVDFITSRCSLGMHIPIERYIDRLCKVSSEDAVFIFGTRHHTYDKTLLRISLNRSYT